MKDKIIDGFLLLIVIVCVFGLIISWNEGQRRKKDNILWSLTKAEKQYIMEELDARSAEDCVLEPIPGGWKCTDNQGKVYKVKKKEEINNGK